MIAESLVTIALMGIFVAMIYAVLSNADKE